MTYASASFLAARRMLDRARALRAIHNGGLPAYWWNRVVNFGDQITPFLVETLSGRSAVNVRGLGIRSTNVLCSAGSILQDLEPGNHVVWGSGFITPEARPRGIPRILALRGPLSGDIATRIGWQDPGKYGDPGLLLPFLLPAERTPSGVAVVPNHALKASTIVDHDDAFLVDPMRGVSAVAREIASAKIVLSSSLHGLILAQAYGRPWVWIRDNSNTLYGGDFKFLDFFASIGIENPPSMFLDGPISKAQVVSASRTATLAEGSQIADRQQDLMASMPEGLDISRMRHA